MLLRTQPPPSLTAYAYPLPTPRETGYMAPPPHASFRYIVPAACYPSSEFPFISMMALRSARPRPANRVALAHTHTHRHTHRHTKAPPPLATALCRCSGYQIPSSDLSICCEWSGNKPPQPSPAQTPLPPPLLQPMFFLPFLLSVFSLAYSLTDMYPIEAREGKGRGGEGGAPPPQTLPHTARQRKRKSSSSSSSRKPSIIHKYA